MGVIERASIQAVLFFDCTPSVSNKLHIIIDDFYMYSYLVLLGFLI